MSQNLDLDLDSDSESVDSQATVVIEDDTFNPIELIDCATLIESGRRITRRMGIFKYEDKGITAFYQSSGTSGASALNGTYVPFYGETNKLLKAVDVFPNTQGKAWKIALRNVHEIRIDHSILNYFQHFYELQISASIDSRFWNGLPYRDFILSHEWDEKIGKFVELLPSPILHSGNFSEMDCASRIEMEKGEINKFLRASGATLGEGQIEAYQLQQEQEKEEAHRLAEMYELQQQQQQQEEDIKESPGRLKIEKGGKSLKKRKIKKSKNLNKKSNKRKKTNKRKTRNQKKYK
jgi:hypothetical protein